MEIQTRFGALKQAYVYFGNEKTDSSPREYAYTGIFLNGSEIARIRGYYFKFAKVLNWAEKGDVVLLGVAPGGSSCGHSYRLLHIIAANNATLSNVFGECARDPSEFGVMTEGIRFRLKSRFPPDLDHLNIHFNGEDVFIEKIMENDDNVSPAAADDDVLRWVGQYPFILFETAGERVRFRQIMTNDELNILRGSLGKRLIVSGGYLIGSGCWPHRCDSYFGYLAIEISTGGPYAAYWHEGHFFVFGSTEEMLPQPMLELIQANREWVRARCESTMFPERYERCITHKDR
jgi:hypothetical protein